MPKSLAVGKMGGRYDGLTDRAGRRQQKEKNALRFSLILLLFPKLANFYLWVVLSYIPIVYAYQLFFGIQQILGISPLRPRLFCPLPVSPQAIPTGKCGVVCSDSALVDGHVALLLQHE